MKNLIFLLLSSPVGILVTDLNESLLILSENLIAGSLVYRDFEPLVANFGDVVNTRRPAEFVAKRKVNADNVVIQDAIASNVQVKLDQHVHTSFLIRDGEESKAFKDLVDEFLRPAMLAQARFIDQIVLGQYVQFFGNSAGAMGGLTGSNARASILGLRQVLNQSKMPQMGRSLILNPVTESTLLGLDLFTSAQQVGDQGQALREASLGRKLGFDMYMDQNMAVVSDNVVATDTLASAPTGGYPVGTTAFVVTTGTAGNFPVGGWVTIAGDSQPMQITAFNAGTKTVTVNNPSKNVLNNGAVLTSFTGGTVNNGPGYPAGYAKEITIAGFTSPLQVGQGVSFGGGDTNTYSVIAVNGLVGITLDRPLVNALTNTQAVLPGPAGNFNFAFHRDAIALVVRPLSRPKPGTGALSAVNNIAA
jgi:hypothetical protein